MNDFDPSVVPPDDDFDADPAEAELERQLDAARALLDGLRPVGDPARFLEDDVLEAATLVRQHDRAYYFRLTHDLRPHKILRQWQSGVAAVARAMEPKEKREKEPSEKTLLVALGLEVLELFHDGTQAWCWPKEHGPGCCWRIPGTEAKRHLLRLYGERFPTEVDGQQVPGAPNRQAVAEALDQLKAGAYGAERRLQPALRVASNGAQGIVIDLCHDDFAVVEITPGGWQVVKPSPVALRRGAGMLPLPFPAQAAGDALAELRTLLELGADNHTNFWCLVVGFAFACYRPGPSFPLLVVSGEQGNGKTFLMRVIRALVDPHDVREQPKPRCEDDLFVNADSQWLLAYDNLSTMSQEWSDAFCRIATGSGYSKRKLYTDRDTSQFRVTRAQMISAIVDVASAPDLLDRSLLVELPKFAEGERKRHEEEELYAKVADLAPRCLGQMLDAAAVALRDQKEVKLATVPRMVGVARWVEAAAKILGLAEGSS